MTRNMQKILLLLVVAGLLLTMQPALLSCSHDSPDATNGSEAEGPNSHQQDQLTIVATVFAAYDFARTITQDLAEVKLLLPPGTEPHSFEPSPMDIMLLNSTDVLICAGGESDAWIERIVSSLSNPNLVVLRMTDMVVTITFDEQDESHTGSANPSAHTGSSNPADATSSQADAAETEIDEHVWTSLRNAEVIVEECAEAFALLDPVNEGAFHTNANSLIAQLQELDESIVEIVATASRDTIVFGDRFPFRYFVEDYGLSWFAAYSGCSTAVETNPQTIISLVDTVAAEGIPVVFYLELSDQRIASTIAAETGAQILPFESAHTVTRNEFEAGITYLDIMRANAKNLEIALN